MMLMLSSIYVYTLTFHIVAFADTIDLLLGVIIFPDVLDAHEFALEAAAILRKDPENGDLVIPDRVYPSLRAAIDGDAGGFNQTAVCGLNSSKLPRTCILFVYNTYDTSDYEINFNHFEVTHSVRDSFVCSRLLLMPSALCWGM